MTQRDQIQLELYRQAWEASRHPWDSLLRFTNLYILVGVALIAFLAQTESDEPLAYLLFVLSAFAWIGLLWTVRAYLVSERWNKIQMRIQETHDVSTGGISTGGITTSPRNKRTRLRDFLYSCVGFTGTYIVIYVGSGLAALVIGILLLNGSFTFSKSTPPVVVQTDATPTSPFVTSDARSDASDLVNLIEIDCFSTFVKQAYCDAIRDSAVANHSEISRELVAITPYGGSDLKMEWSGTEWESLLLTVTLTDYFFSDGSDGIAKAREGYKADEPTLLTRPVWVSIVPGLRDFCKGLELSSEDLKLRLQQRLGLPPSKSELRLVEFWVNPADLFRPSIDPEISDSEAEILSPQSDRFITISPGHLTWFNNKFNTTYSGKNPFPWTRLGYTYDWGTGVKPHTGVSEFVIEKKSTVGVGSIYTPSQYCSTDPEDGG